MLDMVLQRSLKWRIFTSIVYPLLFQNHSLNVIHVPSNLLSLESYKTYNLHGKNKYSCVIGKFLVIGERACVLQEQQGRVEILIGILAKTQIYTVSLPQTRCVLLDDATMEAVFQEHTWWVPTGSPKRNSPKSMYWADQGLSKIVLFLFHSVIC